MTVDQILQQLIEDKEFWLFREKDESTYKRDLKERIELIHWVLENMNDPDFQICRPIDARKIIESIPVWDKPYVHPCTVPYLNLWVFLLERRFFPIYSKYSVKDFDPESPVYSIIC